MSERDGLWTPEHVTVIEDHGHKDLSRRTREITVVSDGLMERAFAFWDACQRAQAKAKDA